MVVSRHSNGNPVYWAVFQLEQPPVNIQVWNHLNMSLIHHFSDKDAQYELWHVCAHVLDKRQLSHLIIIRITHKWAKYIKWNETTQSVIMFRLLYRFALIPSIQCDKWVPSMKSSPKQLSYRKSQHILGCPVISLCYAGQLSPQCEWVRILLCVWKEAAVTLEELSDVSRRWHEVLLCAGLC